MTGCGAGAGGVCMMKDKSRLEWLKNEYNKIDWFEYQKTVLMAGTVIMVVSMCFSVNIIMLGFHNIDLGHNMLRLNELWIVRFNTTMRDEGRYADGTIGVKDASQLIYIGSSQIRNGWGSLMITSILFGIFVTTLRYSKKIY